MGGGGREKRREGKREKGRREQAERAGESERGRKLSAKGGQRQDPPLDDLFSFYF